MAARNSLVLEARLATQDMLYQMPKAACRQRLQRLARCNARRAISRAAHSHDTRPYAYPHLLPKARASACCSPARHFGKISIPRATYSDRTMQTRLRDPDNTPGKIRKEFVAD